MKRSIEVTVSPAGDILINAVGFKGAGCEKATRFLEEALGRCAGRVRKPEFNQKQVQPAKQKVGS